MSQSASGTLIYVSGLYNFASDPNKGAVGTTNLNVLIPKYSQVVNFYAVSLATITSGGAATISFGISSVGVATPINHTAAMSPAIFYAAYNAKDADGNFLPRTGASFWSNPYKCYYDQFVTMSIGTVALTAGQLYFQVTYSINEQ